MDHELSNAVPDVLKRLLVKILCYLEVGGKISKFSSFWGPLLVLYKERIQKDENFMILPPTSR